MKAKGCINKKNKNIEHIMLFNLLSFIIIAAAEVALYIEGQILSLPQFIKL